MKQSIYVKKIEKLRKENRALAAWQCKWQDGVTGLVGDEFGNQKCAQEERANKLMIRCLVLAKALEFYADPFKALEFEPDERVPDFYDELNFGDIAKKALKL